MEVKIRLATPKDAKTMGEIHHHSWEKAYENLMSSDYIRQKFPTTMELYQKTLFENNNIAVKFYEAFGFYQDGLCKEYLCGTVNQVCVRMTVDFCS